MKDAKLYGKSVYLAELSASRKSDFGKRDFDSQSPEQKVFSAIWELESQLGNGGFQGYFGNGAHMADYAPTALRAVGAVLCAAIVEEALALLPSSLPSDLWERWAAVHSTPLVEQLDSLNKRYFEGPEKVGALLYRFVAAHPGAFGPTPPEETLPVPPPPPTPAEIDATLGSLMDSLQGGPEALLKMTGGGCRLDELDPQMQRLATDLANDLSKTVTDFEQGKLAPAPAPTPTERDAMLRSLENLQRAMLGSFEQGPGEESRAKKPEDTGGHDDNSGKS